MRQGETGRGRDLRQEFRTERNMDLRQRGTRIYDRETGRDRDLRQEGLVYKTGRDRD